MPSLPFLIADAPTRPTRDPMFRATIPMGVQPPLPLSGLTVLAVEDSRFACEALRLMCRRAGARLRRAETIAAAQSHLRVYRPDIVIIDLGLPDGRGESLIRDLVLGTQRPPVLLGTSGNPDGRGAALASGADGFLDKPLESLATFCRTLRSHLPDLDFVPVAEEDEAILPDPLALQDDLSQAAAALDGDPSPAKQRYLAGFVRGLARHAGDKALEDAARNIGTSPDALETLRQLIGHRCAIGATAFDYPSRRS